MKHLKLFENVKQYESYKNGSDYVLPNVSYVKETKGVTYEAKKEYILRAKYEATPDNLVAFTGASNVRALTVNGTPIKIEPIKNETTTFDVLGENISINLDTSEATFPESYLVKSPVSSWSFKAKDPNYVINENTYVCGLMMMDGMTMAQPMSPEEMNYMFTTNDGVTIEVIDEFLNEMNAQIAMGAQISFTLMDVDMDSQTFTFIDTEHQTNVTTGGMSAYLFDSEGLYDVKIELANPDLKNIRFAGTPLTSIEIGNDITSIGEGVFYDSQTYQSCDSLESVTIGRGVISIGNYAFRDCRKLTNVYISDIAAWCNISFSDFESNPLNGAHNLYLNNELVTDLVIPDSVTKIEERAFGSFDGLTSITIGDSVTSIGDYAFAYCSGLTSVTIGDSVTTIGDYAFAYCSSLASITCYAPTPPTIYNNTFNSINTYGTLYYPDGSDYSNWLSILKSYCWNVTITAQYNVTSSYNYRALSSTSEISHLYVNGTKVTDFGNQYSFKSKGSYTVGIVLKDNVVDIQTMFSNVEALNSVIINNSVTSIGNYAFSGCSNLTSITIPDSVTSIGSYAFDDCSKLTSITIPDSVKSIGSYAFSDCHAIKDVNLNVTNLAEYCKGNAIGSIPGNKHLYINNKEITELVIPNSVTTIGHYAFYKCSSLTSITIPNSVTSIGQFAFSGCSNLTSITIPDSVTSIGSYAFDDCNNLASITCYATTAPSIQSSTFDNVLNSGTLYVPTGSDYSSWMSSDYLGKYNWTIQYI